MSHYIIGHGRMQRADLAPATVPAAERPHAEQGNFDGVSLRFIPCVNMQQGHAPCHVDVYAKNARGFERSVRVGMPPPMNGVYTVRQLHGIVMQLSQAATELLGMHVEMAGKARELKDQHKVARKLEHKRES
jgi:hypothetical protein